MLFLRINNMTPKELKEHREKTGFSQAGYARHLGITPTTLWRYEAEKAPIPNWLIKIVELEKQIISISL